MRALSAYNIAYAALPATNAYMYFTPTADAAKQKQFTLHIPLGLIKSGAQTVFAAGDGASTNFVSVNITANNQLDFVLMSGGAYVGRRTTTRKLEDYAGFYAITLVMDTPNATALDRMRVYFDLVRETDFATTANPTQNLATSVFNGSYQHHFLKLDYAAYYADVNLGGNTCLIGQALGPDSFLDLDLVTGNVKAKNISSLSPEYLFMFENAGAMGTNSGSAGDVTVSGMLNQVMSTPTNVHCAFNPLFSDALARPNAGFSDGNRKATTSGTAYWYPAVGTLMADSGKFYAEFEIILLTDFVDSFVGICNSKYDGSAVSPYIGGDTNGYGYHPSVAGIAHNDSYISAAAFTLNDTIGIELDLDSKVAKWYKNGVYQNQYTGLADGLWTFALSTIYGKTYEFRSAEADWKYSPSAGFVELCTNNLPAQGNVNDHLIARLRTGTGDSTAVTGLPFAPAALISKSRAVASWWRWFDAARGTEAGDQAVYSNSTSAEGTGTDAKVFFTSDGYYLDQGPTSSWEPNGIGDSYIDYLFNLPNTKTSGWAGSPTITPTKEIYNADLGMSIITYTGNGAAGATIPHSQGKTPGMIMIKRLDVADNWRCYHSALGATKNLLLDLTNAAQTETAVWNDTEPTSQVFSVGTALGVNASGGTYVAYVFAETNFIKTGSFIGNGSINGPMVNTGTSVMFNLMKRTDAVADWSLLDGARPGYNRAYNLFPDTSGVENTTTWVNELVSNGFKMRQSYASQNASGGTFIYLTIGQPNGPIENAAR